MFWWSQLGTTTAYSAHQTLRAGTLSWGTKWNLKDGTGTSDNPHGPLGAGAGMPKSRILILFLSPDSFAFLIRHTRNSPDSRERVLTDRANDSPSPSHSPAKCFRTACTDLRSASTVRRMTNTTSPRPAFLCHGMQSSSKVCTASTPIAQQKL